MFITTLLCITIIAILYSWMWGEISIESLKILGVKTCTRTLLVFHFPKFGPLCLFSEEKGGLNLLADMHEWADTGTVIICVLVGGSGVP